MALNPYFFPCETVGWTNFKKVTPDYQPAGSWWQPWLLSYGAEIISKGCRFRVIAEETE